jgi:hypothetical protein
MLKAIVKIQTILVLLVYLQVCAKYLPNVIQHAALSFKYYKLQN